jgi:hypothetical protein
MGQIEPAAPRQQELAGGRSGLVEHDHALARFGENLGRHQPGRAGADDYGRRVRIQSVNP